MTTNTERYLQPDWSKAPEDAEYYAPMSECGSYFPVWIKGDLNGDYNLAFALKNDDEGPFIDFATETPYWTQCDMGSSEKRTEYYKSVLIPSPSF